MCLNTPAKAASQAVMTQNPGIIIIAARSLALGCVFKDGGGTLAAQTPTLIARDL